MNDRTILPMSIEDMERLGTYNSNDSVTTIAFFATRDDVELICDPIRIDHEAFDDHISMPHATVVSDHDIVRRAICIAIDEHGVDPAAFIEKNVERYKLVSPSVDDCVNLDKVAEDMGVEMDINYYDNN